MSRLKSVLWTTDGIGDGNVDGYPQEDVIQWQRILWLNDPTTMGVAKGFLNELEVTNPAGRTLQVDTGGCIVYGFPGWLLTACTHTLTLPVIDTTGWRLVVRVNWATKEMTSELLQSADGVAAIPDVTQTGGTVWEISLAYGTITVAPVVTVTDDRTFISVAGQGGSFAGETITPTNIKNRTRRFWCAAVNAWNSTVGSQPWWWMILGRGWRFADAATIDGYGAFVVPTDFVSDMVVKAIIMGEGDPGNCWLGADAYYCADGEAWNAHTATFVDAAIADPGNGILAEVCQMNLAAAAVGDSVELEFKRTGGAGGDTSTNDIYFLGWIVEYTADG